MHRFTLIPTLALMTLLATTTLITMMRGVTARTPHDPILSLHNMSNTTPTAQMFYIKIDGFKDKTILTFGSLESMLTLQIPLNEIDTEFYNWIKTTLPKSEGGQGKVTRNTVRNALLIAYDAEGKEVLRWNLTNAWIRSYKLLNLDTTSKDSAVATLEMVFDDIQRRDQRQKVGLAR